MNAAYVKGAVLTRAFAENGFCTAIRGAEGGGRVDNLPTHVPQIRAGKERALVILGQDRIAAVGDVRSMADLGHRDFDTSGWAGVAVRAETPRPIVEKLSRELQRIARLPEVRKRFEDPGFVMVGGTPEQFDQRIAADVARWHGLIRQLDIRAE